MKQLGLTHISLNVVLVGLFWLAGPDRDANRAAHLGKFLMPAAFPSSAF